eukprot:TRINITY_DN29458_c0_g1_i1.p1 TRINITY_DN29458_c0_g1~~TRINITY_DN29458_c0_g1_i1.p1  ORF type:complete len:1136 (-),score=197.81 TRINITY_DN29458_c0_g1_i1:419-3826(-)
MAMPVFGSLSVTTPTPFQSSTTNRIVSSSQCFQTFLSIARHTVGSHIRRDRSMSRLSALTGCYKWNSCASLVNHSMTLPHYQAGASQTSSNLRVQSRVQASGSLAKNSNRSCSVLECKLRSTSSYLHSVNSNRFRANSKQRSHSRHNSRHPFHLAALSGDNAGNSYDNVNKSNAGRSEGEGQGQDTGSNVEKDDGPSEIQSNSPIVRAINRWFSQFRKEFEEEVGFDLGKVPEGVQEVGNDFKEGTEELPEIGTAIVEAVGEFIGDLRRRMEESFFRAREWSQMMFWKDVRSWSAVRWTIAVLGALLAALVVGVGFRTAQRVQVRQSAQTLVEAAFPEATPENVQRVRRRIWQSKHPPGVFESKYTLGPDGEYHRDLSYPGESDVAVLVAQSESGASAASAAPVDLAPSKPLAERLADWQEALFKEGLREDLEADISRFVPHFNWEEVARGYREGLAAVTGARPQQLGVRNSAEFWVARQWWRYRPSMPYTWLLRQLEQEQVQAAVFTEDLRSVYVFLASGFPSQFKVNIPVDPWLFSQLELSGAQIGVVPRSPLSNLRGVAILAPSLLLLSLIHRLIQDWRGRLLEKDSDYLRMDRDQLITPEEAERDNLTKFEEVILGPNVWQALEEIMTYMRNPMKFHGARIKLPRGILVSGPPGTGKTLLARAIARESGVSFVFASGAEFVDTGAKSGAEKLFDAFFTARANAPAFLFIDEIDALAGSKVVADPERREVFEQLIMELDGAIEHTDVYRYSLRQAVILIGATNRPDELHPDLMKAGRIDREIYIGLPGEAERIKIFGVHSRNRTLAPDVDFSKIVFRTVGFSGADIRNLVNEAAIVAIRHNRRVVEQADIVEALDKQVFEGLGITQTREEELVAFQDIPETTRRLLAVHEAGHVLLAHIFPQFDWHALTHLLPGGKEMALSVFYPCQRVLDSKEPTEGYLRMQMVVAHGGRCAERMVFGPEQLTDGGQDDLMKISKIARELTVSAANPRFGLVPLVSRPMEPPQPGGQGGATIPDEWGRADAKVADMSIPVSDMFTREVTRYITETESLAIEGLNSNRHIYDALVEMLYSNMRVTGQEVAELINGMNPVMLPDFLESPPFNMEDILKADLKLDPNRIGHYYPLEVFPAPMYS